MAAQWVYTNIATVNGQVVAILKKFGVTLNPSQSSRLQQAFANIQRAVDTGQVWNRVHDAHVTALAIWKEGLKGKNPPDQGAKELGSLMTSMNGWVPGAGSPFNQMARTLGGAARDLGKGVAAAAKFTGKAFVDVSNSALWKIVAGAA